jgi:hypothetical protein
MTLHCWWAGGSNSTFTKINLSELCRWATVFPFWQKLSALGTKLQKLILGSSITSIGVGVLLPAMEQATTSRISTSMRTLLETENRVSSQIFGKGHH